MTRLQTWSIRIGVPAMAAILAAFATALWLDTAPMRRPAPPLVAGLSGNWAKVSVAFDARVRARYPIGASEGSLGADLAAQGFRRIDWSSSSADEHQAVLTRRSLICVNSYSVFWRVDANRTLTLVRGEHPAPACA